MNSKRIGNIGEAKALPKFVELGIPVYIPFGDNESADLIAEFNGKLNKIQCKTTAAISEQSIITWNLRSIVVTTGNRYKVHNYTDKEVDYFVLYHSVLDLLLIVPFSEISNKSSISFTYPFRVVKTATNQRDYRDYLFDKSNMESKLLR
jgi:hypothetical protein